MSFSFRKNSNLAYTLVAAFLDVHPRVIETNVGQRSLRRIRMHICMPETDSEDAWTQRCREGLGLLRHQCFLCFVKVDCISVRKLKNRVFFLTTVVWGRYRKLVMLTFCFPCQVVCSCM